MGNISSQDAYTGTANFGRAATDVRAIFATVFAIPMIIIGLYLILKKVKRTATVQGKIQSRGSSPNMPYTPCSPTYNETCTQSQPDAYGNVYLNCNTTTSYMCSFNVEYNLPGGGSNNVTKSFSTNGGQQYSYDEMITLYYDPNDPTNIDLYQDNYAFLGWMLIVIAVIILISAWVWVYLTHASKLAAAYAGVETGAELAGNAIRQF